MTWMPDTNELAPGVTIERRTILWVPLALAAAIYPASLNRLRFSGSASSSLPPIAPIQSSTRCLRSRSCVSYPSRTDSRWRQEFLYSRAATIYGGTGEIQRNIIARRLLDLGSDR